MEEATTPETAATRNVGSASSPQEAASAAVNAASAARAAAAEAKILFHRASTLLSQSQWQHAEAHGSIGMQSATPETRRAEGCCEGTAVVHRGRCNVSVGEAIGAGDREALSEPAAASADTAAGSVEPVAEAATAMTAQLNTARTSWSSNMSNGNRSSSTAAADTSVEALAASTPGGHERMATSIVGGGVRFDSAVDVADAVGRGNLETADSGADSVDAEAIGLVDISAGNALAERHEHPVTADVKTECRASPVADEQSTLDDGQVPSVDFLAAAVDWSAMTETVMDDTLDDPIVDDPIVPPPTPLLAIDHLADERLSSPVPVQSEGLAIPSGSALKRTGFTRLALARPPSLGVSCARFVEDLTASAAGVCVCGAPRLAHSDSALATATCAAPAADGSFRDRASRRASRLGNSFKKLASGDSKKLAGGDSFKRKKRLAISSSVLGDAVDPEGSPVARQQER